MSKHKQIYKQCTMEKQLSNLSKQVDIAWIPALFAKVGKRLSIKNSQEEWIDGWVVVFVGSSTEFDIIDSQRDAQKRWERVLGAGVRE